MPTSQKSSTNSKMQFITLTLSQGINAEKSGTMLFDQREFCDELLKTLIYSIEHNDLILFGFVMTSNQVHLIAITANGDLAEKIEHLKKRSAKAIINKVTKKLNSLTQIKIKNHQDIRRIFSEFLNSSDNSFWQKDEKFIELSIDDNAYVLEPLSNTQLTSYLTDNDRNYLQLGASAFTKLMMKSMKI